MGDRPISVLLVEDNPGDARLIQEALKDAAEIDSAGPTFRLTRAERLADGLARLTEGEVDVLLLDLSLPDSHGFETFTRAQARAPGVPIVVLSGLDDHVLAVRAVRQGAQDYLVKGQVDGQLLVRSLRYAVERKQAEQERARLIREQVARAEAEAVARRLQQVLDVLPEAIALVDVDGRIVLRNAAARAFWGSLGGRDGEDDVARYDRIAVFHLDGSPWPAEETPLGRSIRHGEVVRGQQMLVHDASSGQDVPVLVSSAPLREDDGSIVGGVAVFQDISSIKELERHKDEFLAAASHDLKTPLATIKGLSQLLRRQAQRSGTLDETRVLAGLSRIDLTVSRLTRMVNDLLDITRMQMERPLDLDRRPTDLVGLANRVAAESQLATERHRIRVDSAAPSLPGRWDVARVERALANLLGNAIKYTPDGGEITVRVSREVNGHGAFARLDVRDSGLGIPPDELERVFDRFYRASNVVEGTSGTGIGLTGARQIVQEHGGQITVESRVGQGSIFTVRLPLDEPPALSGQQRAHRPTADG